MSSADFLPVVIINLPECRDRHEHMLEQCQNHGIAPEFFPAIDGQEDHPLFERIDFMRRQRYKGKPFTAGERGCWASHYLVWERCVALDRPIIVLEDDATLCNGFADFLAVAGAIAHQVPYARLYLGAAPSRQIATVGDYTIHRHRHTPFGTVAYLLTPGAARRFLKHADAWVLAVDDYMDLSWLHGVERLAISPPLIELDQAFGSLVQATTKPPLGVFGKLQREFFRAYLGIRRWMHDLFAK